MKNKGMFRMAIAMALAVQQGTAFAVKQLRSHGKQRLVYGAVFGVRTQGPIQSRPNAGFKRNRRAQLKGRPSVCVLMAIRAKTRKHYIAKGLIRQHNRDIQLGRRYAQ